MLIGGLALPYRPRDDALASVLVLAADGSGWSGLPPLTGARAFTTAALLPDGKVLVAGGMSGTANDVINTAINTAELWDPATQKWTALPSMMHERVECAACVLPSGRVAVVGGHAETMMMAETTTIQGRRDGEVFDPVKREWEPLGAQMAHRHFNIRATAVAGGMLLVSDRSEELYDERSGRWFQLPTQWPKTDAA
jgi:hypothetical protein